MPQTQLLAIGALALALGAQAYAGCAGHDIARRNPGGKVVNSYSEWAQSERRETFARRQMATVTDEASAAVSTDPSTECTAYSYAPWSAMKANFPTIWQTAYILPGDTEAESLFATINATVNQRFGNIQPHGTNNGDFQGVHYNNTDPDCWWTWKGCTTPAASTGLKADITTVPEPLTWGLGFDDGPNCSHNAFYDFLRDQGQKATMYYIGSNVGDWPLQAMRGLADGHQIAVHTWSHQYMTSFSNENAFAELYYTRKIIKDVLGVTPMYWRPPYGDVDNRIRAIAEGLNLTNVVWSDDSEDWREGAPGQNVTAADVTANYQAVVDKVANGTYANHGPVVLTHELTNFTMSEFISQYASIKAAFKWIVPIASAYNDTNPYAEGNVTYPDFMAMTNQSSTASTTGSASGSMSGASQTGSMSGSASHSGTAVAAKASSSASASGTKSSSAGRVEVAAGAILGAAGLAVLCL